MLTNHYNTIQEVLQGINIASNIITSTMGGAGKNVLMFKDNQLVFTKDGVSVAREVGFKDVQQNIGAQLLINAASMTVKSCGDGTTLTSLLVKEFTNRLFQEIENGAEVNDLLDQTRQLIADVSEYLKKNAKQIESTQDVYDIALTSCKNAKLAALIQQIFLKASLDANITLEKSNFSKQTYVEYTEGLSFESGHINSGFSNRDNGNCVFEKPEVWIHDKMFNHKSEVEEIINDNHKRRVPLVIIAKGFSEEIIRYCLYNRKAINVEVCLVKLPGFMIDDTKDNMNDIKAFLSPGGTANRIVVQPESFTIYNNPNKAVIRKRVTQLKAKADNSPNEWDVKKLNERASNLQQKSAIIFVGGITEKNQAEEYDRIEDAIGAVKSATVLGYVPGTGVTLLKYALKNNLPAWFAEILMTPVSKILLNANMTISQDMDNFRPFNVRSRDYDDSLIDPVFILITALENSFALAELLVNTSFIIHD